MKHQSILCDVNKCKFNRNGKVCNLETIKVTCDCVDCTCCGSYEEE